MPCLNIFFTKNMCRENIKRSLSRLLTRSDDSHHDRHRVYSDLFLNDRLDGNGSDYTENGNVNDKGGNDHDSSHAFSSLLP